MYNPILKVGALLFAIALGVGGGWFFTKRSADTATAGLIQRVNVFTSNAFSPVCGRGTLSNLSLAPATKTNPLPVYPAIAICADGTQHIVYGPRVTK